jgi:hypothetical protein
VKDRQSRHALKQHCLDQISRLGRRRSLIDRFFAPGSGFDQLWEQATVYKREGDFHRGERILHHPDGDLDLWKHGNGTPRIAWGKRSPETRRAICFDCDNDNLHILSDALWHLTDASDLKALHRLADELPGPLKNIIAEYLTAPPSKQASPAFRRMFVAADHNHALTTGELRSHIKELAPFQSHAQVEQQQRQPGRSDTAMAAWQRVTGMHWRFVAGNRPYYESNPPQMQRHRFMMSGIYMPEFVTAYRIVESVNYKAAQEGESLELRADHRIERQPDGRKAHRLLIPAQLFNDPVYAKELREHLRTDKAYSDRWRDKSYRQSMKEANVIRNKGDHKNR